MVYIRSNEKSRPSGSTIIGENGKPIPVNENQTDINFYKVMTENMKYAFHSPIPTTTQFPTPYSTNQIQDGHLQVPNRQNKIGSKSEGDSSLIENSMLPGVNMGAPTNHTGLKGETLNDINMQPSSALQCGNFPNEFLLASPEQFREFLLESPGGLNLFNKTPAKTPLRFFTDSNTGGSAGFQGSNNLFGTNLGSLSKSRNSQTPLRNIDLNLMFNSNQMSISSSPSKGYSVSLTPYGKKVLNEIGTPYAKNLVSSNSAFADFQKARKDTVRLQKTPDTASKYASMDKVMETPRDSSFKVKHISLTNAILQDINDNEQSTDTIYGSSPTTIQLNSSVTKSSAKLDSNRIQLISHGIDNSNIDSQLFNLEMGVLPISPTPKNHNSHIDALRIPELPKMGSFTSERSLSITSTMSTKSTTSTVRTGKIKKTIKKQPKFQIIVSNAHKFNTTKGFIPNNVFKTNKKSSGKLKRTRSLVVSPSVDSNKNQTNDNDQQQTQSFSGNHQNGQQFPNSQ